MGGPFGIGRGHIGDFEFVAEQQRLAPGPNRVRVKDTFLRNLRPIRGSAVPARGKFALDGRSAGLTLQKCEQRRGVEDSSSDILCGCVATAFAAAAHPQDPVHFRSPRTSSLSCSRVRSTDSLGRVEQHDWPPFDKTCPLAELRRNDEASAIAHARRVPSHP